MSCIMFLDVGVFRNMKKQFTTADVRAEFVKRIQGRRQAEVAREVGVKPQNLSTMIKGAPIHGKVLAWLGYRRVEGIYERVA